MWFSRCRKILKRYIVQQKQAIQEEFDLVKVWAGNSEDFGRVSGQAALVLLRARQLMSEDS